MFNKKLETKTAEEFFRLRTDKPPLCELEHVHIYNNQTITTTTNQQNQLQPNYNNLIENQLHNNMEVI